MSIEYTEIDDIIFELQTFKSIKEKVEDLTDLIEYAKGMAIAENSINASPKENKFNHYARELLGVKTHNFSTEEHLALLPIRLKTVHKSMLVSWEKLYKLNIDINTNSKIYNSRFSLKQRLANQEASENNMKVSIDGDGMKVLDKIGT